MEKKGQMESSFLDEALPNFNKFNSSLKKKRKNTSSIISSEFFIDQGKKKSNLDSTIDTFSALDKTLTTKNDSISNFSLNDKHNNDIKSIKELKNISNQNLNLNKKIYCKDILGNPKALICGNNFNDESDIFNYSTLKLKEIKIPGETDNDFYYEQKHRYNSNIDFSYFDKQIYIDGNMRTILLEWMMDLCCQLGFKRSTFHLSVVLVDVSLSKLDRIHNSKLQLVGITCVIIAAKYEEICCPNLQMYSYSTGDSFSVGEIVEYEQVILKLLKWKINYPTLALWINMITFKWDLWLHNKVRNEKIFRSMPFFRLNNNICLSFEKIFIAADLSVLVEESIGYHQFKFSCALLYIIVGLFSNSILEDTLYSIVKENLDLSCLDECHILNNIVEMYFNECLNCSLQDIACHIKIASTFVLKTNEFNLEIRKKTDLIKVFF